MKEVESVKSNITSCFSWPDEDIDAKAWRRISFIHRYDVVLTSPHHVEIIFDILVPFSRWQTIQCNA